MENMSANLNVIMAACAKVSRFILRDFGEIEQLQSSTNGSANFAAASKLKIEKTLAESLLEARPKFGLMSRGQETKGSDISHRFIVSALDGFENFARGIPFFAISIAIQEQKNLHAAAVYSPVFDKMFYAERGSGAFVAEARMTRRIRVSKRVEAKGAAIAASGGANVPGGITFGSDALALAYLAAGMVDGFVGRRRGVFDLSAGLLLVKEAGGMAKAFDADGRATDRIFEAETIICENNYLQPGLISTIIKKTAI